MSGCTVTTQDDAGLARNTLIGFFNHLANGDYQEAAGLYGGEYDVLRQMNPEIDPNDYSSLWNNACQSNGFQCIRIKHADLVDQSLNVFTFLVEFNNSDGSLFIQGPCCGETISPEQTISIFTYHVNVLESGNPVVMDLPVYLP
jgi:hypothetical protein